MRYFIWTFLLTLSPGLLNWAYAGAGASPISCRQTYALCTAAQCIPDPRNPKYAVCACSKQDGDSMGYTSCALRKPYTDQSQVLHIISTFSLVNPAHYKGMECQSGIWTNCLDQPCTVNPLNPKQAICSCPIATSGKFVTFGGHCNPASCSAGFWSAASATQVEQLLSSVRKKSRQTISSNTDLMCPLEEQSKESHVS